MTSLFLVIIIAVVGVGYILYKILENNRHEGP